jgi:tetrahydromethanopterin S-methyltransferase subunit C
VSLLLKSLTLYKKSLLKFMTVAMILKAVQTMSLSLLIGIVVWIFIHVKYVNGNMRKLSSRIKRRKFT